ncbi:MAG: SPOR domain-containing protein [Treponema sp.]|nr:SPOR domain-containing protein [Treponema sp.]
MEQKRTLWIIAAAGMFLLVVLGAAFILYSPAQKSAPQAITKKYEIPNPAVQNPQGWTNVPGSYNENQLLPPGEIHTKDLTVYTDNAVVYGRESDEGTTIDLNALKAAQNMAPAQETFPQNINITVNIPDAKTESPVQPVYVAQNEKVYEAPAEKAPVSVKKAETVKNVAAVKTQPKAAPATKQSSKTDEAKIVEKKQAVISQYWVQAAAYSNKKSAENARTILDDNKIPADIFTYQDAKGKVFYRVRVGPYTTKSEAEYWRTKIEKIDVFSTAESYITQN